MTTATAPKPTVSTVTDDLLQDVRVKSQDHIKVFLGRYDELYTPKGFAIELRPSTVPEHLIITRITRLDDVSNTKFFLEIYNQSGRSVRAKVRHV